MSGQCTQFSQMFQHLNYFWLLSWKISSNKHVRFQAIRSLFYQEFSRKHRKSSFGQYFFGNVSLSNPQQHMWTSDFGHMTETSRILNPPPTNTNKPAFLSSFHVKISLNLLSDEVMNLLILFLFSFYTTHALTDLDFNLIPIRRKAKSIENSTTSSQESTQHRPESKSEHYVVVPPLETRENPPEIRQERPPRPNSEDTSKTLFGQPPQSWDLGGNQPQKVTLGRQLVPAHFRNLKHGHISSNLRRSEGGDMYQVSFS